MKIKTHEEITALIHNNTKLLEEVSESRTLTKDTKRINEIMRGQARISFHILELVKNLNFCVDQLEVLVNANDTKKTKTVKKGK